MTELKVFKDRVLEIKEEILSQKRPECYETMKELTSDPGFRREVTKYAGLTVKMINKEINFEDYKVALAMIRATVDVALIYLMEKYDLQFTKKI